MSTRDNMRRELKELAKLAETMGKESAADATATQGHDSITFPATNLERPVTPASSSRVSVGPFATSTAPPVFEIPEPNKRSGSRTGFVAVVVGASLAVALVGGAFVGKSLAGGSTTAAPITAAAVAPPTPVAPQAEVAPAAPLAAAPQDLAVPPVSPMSASTGVSPAAAATVHKHIAKPATVTKAPTSTAATAMAATPANASSAVAGPKPAAAPALAKPKAAATGGSGDSLEDLIRKEVAAQKK